VSLEGSLETIALPDVLALLSVTTKTGELRVESGQVGGSVWMDAGRIAGFDVGGATTVADALFTLLRLTEGSFYFRAEGTPPPKSVPAQDVAPVLEEAEARLAEWPAIAAVVPSLSSQLQLSEAIPAAVTLEPAQWRLVASIGAGRAVGDVLADLRLGEFQGCKAIKELVDLGLVQSPAPDAGELPAGQLPVEDVTEEPPAEEADLANFAPVTDLSEVWGEPDIEEPTPEPEPEPVNRGLLLKFLGSARN
jgi:hypothetical protein